MPTARRALTEKLEDRRHLAATLPQVFGGGGFDNAERVVETRSGAVVVTGLFSGTANFAAAGQRAAVLTASGDTDIFVAQYAADGQLNWAIRVGGDYSDKELRKFKDRDIQINQTRFSRYVGQIGGHAREAGEYVNDIAVDDNGNVLLAGAFRGSIRAGNFKLTADRQYTSDYSDALVLKISSAGAVTYAKQFGGAFDDDALSIGVDRNGAATIGGYYTRQANFDGGRARGFVKSEGRDGGYVLRLAADGAFGWIYQFDSDSIGTDERNAVNSLAVTRSGVVYFAGTFAADADFQPGRASELILEAEGKTDSVVGQLTRRGGLVWVQSTGSDDYDGNSALALDAAGNVYTAGYFSEEMDVDPRPDVEKLFTPASEDEDDDNPEFSDLLISKFTADGTPVWQNQIGGEYIEIVADITVDADGGVYTVGSFFNTMDADPGRGKFLLDSTPTNDGSIKDKNTRFGRNESYDWFVTKFSPAGKFVGAVNIGRADDDYAGGVTAFSDGTLAVYGRIVNSDIPDRDDRQEQAWVYALSPNLKQL